jgi:hypothetical protein
VSSTAPYLTIVVTGRNDDHGAEFRTRFFRTLEFNHRELTARRIPHEFVMVEWAPQEHRALLVDLVHDAVPTLGPACFRGYVVDPQYQDAFSLNPRMRYLEYIAKNIGIRRAAAPFVLSTNCDVILGRHVLDVLGQQALEPRVVYRASRHDLKMSLNEEPLTWELLENRDHLEREPAVLKPPLMGGGTGDFLLLDRESFHAVRGFNEVYRVTRVGLDQNFVVKAISSGLSVSDIGGPVYHLNHEGSFQLTRHQYAGREDEAPYGDIRWHSRAIVYDNPPTWGLADVTPRAISERVSVFYFSWKAVPPLANLKGVAVADPSIADQSRYRSWHLRIAD